VLSMIFAKLGQKRIPILRNDDGNRACAKAKS